MNSGTLAIVRFLAAAFAGISGYLFSGNLGLEAKIPWNKTQIRATGTFAAFVVVLLLFFYGVPGIEEPDVNQTQSGSGNIQVGGDLTVTAERPQAQIEISGAEIQEFPLVVNHLFAIHNPSKFNAKNI